MIRILIIDGNEDSTRLYSLILREYETKTVINRNDAIKAVLEFSPDLVLVDRYMAGITLESFVAQMKVFHRAVKLVLMSASDDGANVAAWLNIFYAKKPLGIDELRALVSKTLESGEHIAMN